MNTIDKYLHDFVSLNTATIAGKKAPHKAVLLLAIMDLIADGTIETNHIVLSDELNLRFGQIWKQYIQADAPFQQKVGTPYWHLKNEPFYHLYFTDGTRVTEIDNPYSVTRLRELVYASLDEDLFELIKAESTREELSAILIINYLEVENFNELSSDVNIQKQLIEIVKNRNEECLIKILVECSGRNIGIYRNAIKELIETSLVGEDFWWFTRIVFRENPTMFMLPIVESLENIQTRNKFLVPDISNKLIDIVGLLFKDSNNLSHDISFMYLFRDYYDEKMPEIIKQISNNIQQPDVFFKLFEIYHINGKDKISFLLSVRNEASLYAICQLFIDKDLQTRLLQEENNLFENTEYRKAIYNLLNNKTDYEKLAKRIILSSIKHVSKDEQAFIDSIIVSGFEKFYVFLHKGQAKRKHLDTVRNMDSDIGNSYAAVISGESVNHYVLIIKTKGIIGLLPKQYTIQTNLQQGDVIKVKVVGVDKYKKFYFVSQIECGIQDIYKIPLANLGDEVIVSYFDEGRTCNIRSGCLKQINPIIIGQKEHFDYKAKYVAIIVGRRGFYDYEMKIKQIVRSPEKQNIRLSQVARELNVGCAQLSYCLGLKGIHISASPNTKLNSSQYEILIKEFKKE